MNRATVILFMGATLLLTGCTGTGTGDVAADIDTVRANHDHVIRYGGDGFEPARMTVALGETVAWVSSGPDMWVASNGHPTHADYGLDQHGDPVFDQGEDGPVFTFTFNRTGEWQYHNHLNAYHHGTVIVEDE